MSATRAAAGALAGVAVLAAAAALLAPARRPMPAALGGGAVARGADGAAAKRLARPEGGETGAAAGARGDRGAPAAPSGLVARVVAAAPLRRELEVVLAQGSVELRRARTERGLARFDGLPPGRYLVSLEAGALPPGWVALPDAGASATAPAARRAVDVRAGPPAAVELHVAPAAALAGRVLDERGRPVGGLALRIVERDPPRRLHVTTSDADGAFALDDLPPGRFVVAADGVDEPVSLALAPGARGWLELVAPRERASLRGRLLDRRGAPVAGAWLACALEGAALDDLPPAARRLARARTDADGAFLFDGLPPARVRVALEKRVPARGPAPRVARSFAPRVVDLDPRAPVELGTLVVALR